MTQDQKKLAMTAAGVVIIVIGAILITSGTKQPSEPQGTATEQTETGELAKEKSPGTDDGEAASKSAKKSSAGPSGTVAKTSPPPSGSPPERPLGEVMGAYSDPHDGLTFQEAMQLFGLFSYRYQFVNCRGTPGHYVIKQGVKFMLDNRDPLEHLIAIAARNWLIPGYDFVIAKSQEIGKQMITCDNGGAAEMTVVP